MALNPHDVSPKVHPQGHHRCAVQEGRYGWQRSNLASGCGGYDPRPPSHARRPPRPRASRRRPGGNRSPDRALACVLVHDPFEAEDITQEAFLRAWRNLDLLSDPAKFGAWLRRIVFGVSIDWLRVFRPDLYRSTGPTEGERPLEQRRTSGGNGGVARPQLGETFWDGESSVTAAGLIRCPRG
jgi:hypothetical protein